MAKRRSTAAKATARTVCVETSSLIGRLTSASSAALRQRRAAGVHQEAGGGGPGVGPLLAGRQPLHQTHLHRNRGELRSAACFLLPASCSLHFLLLTSRLVPQPSLGVSRAGKAMIFVIVGPVGPYFATGSFNPVSLLADPSFVRAWKGGVGAYKMGG